MLQHSYFPDFTFQVVPSKSVKSRFNGNHFWNSCLKIENIKMTKGAQEEKNERQSHWQQLNAPNKEPCVRTEALTAVRILITVFYDVTPHKCVVRYMFWCNLLSPSSRQKTEPADSSKTAVNYLQNYIASHSRKLSGRILWLQLCTFKITDKWQSLWELVSGSCRHGQYLWLLVHSNKRTDESGLERIRKEVITA
jgi:hypothetical protein